MNGIPQQDEPFVDTIEITPSNNPFIALVSHAPGGDDWIADLLAGAPRTERPCPDREPIVIDGYPGVLAPDCFDGTVAFVTVQDRALLHLALRGRRHRPGLGRSSPPCGSTPRTPWTRHHRLRPDHPELRSRPSARRA